MRKKVLSVFLAMCMIATLITPVYATSKTRDDAINWVRSKENQTIGSGQCVALISAYYSYLGASPVSGNACDYATNALPSGWTREKGGVPKKGDILVYTGGYGHVAIAETTRYGWHQNWGGQYVQWVDRNYNSSFYSSYEGVTKTYWGCIRPNFSDTPSDPLGKPVDIGTDFYAVLVNVNAWKHLHYEENGNVDLRAAQDNTRQIWKFERQNDLSYKIISTYDGKLLDVDGAGKTNGTNVQTYTDHNNDAQKWFFYGSSGHYYIRAKHSDLVLDLNGNNSADGTNIQMWEYNGTDAQIYQVYHTDMNSPSLNVTAGTSTTNTHLSWTNAPGTNVYNVRIKKGEEDYTVWNVYTTQCDKQLPAGTYTAYIDACNATSVRKSNTVTFEVKQPSIALQIDAVGSVCKINTSITNLMQDAVCIAASYKTDGTLLETDSVNLHSGDSSAFFAFVNNTDMAYIKVFLWDSLETMQPLIECEKIDL